MMPAKMLTMVFLPFTLGGCYWGKITCGDAFSCVQLEQETDASCLVPAVDQATTVRWVAKNFDDNGKTIYVTYRKDTQHRNTLTPLPDEADYEMAIVRTTGTTPLVCQRDNFAPPQVFEEHSLTKVSACYEGECPSPAPSKPANPRPNGVTCEEICKSGDDCVRATTVQIPGAQNPLMTMSQGLINEPLPGIVSTNGLVALINASAGTNNCRRGDLLLSAGHPTGAGASFTNDGTTCSFQFTLQNHDFQSVHFAFNGRWSGALKRDVGSYAMLSAPAPDSPVLTVVTKDGAVERERVTGVSGTPSRMLITGEYKYCALLTWSDAGRVPDNARAQ